MLDVSWADESWPPDELRGLSVLLDGVASFVKSAEQRLEAGISSSFWRLLDLRISQNIDVLAPGNRAGKDEASVVLLI